ncbi:hypothetical protein [Paenibacillus sp. HGH0039]|nr:hypothetical protein [Paenibacillus sp. HGH0039]
MSYWNEYIMALSFITTESKRTLTLGIAYLMEVQRYATDWGALFAGLVIVNDSDARAVRSSTG